MVTSAAEFPGVMKQGGHNREERRALLRNGELVTERGDVGRMLPEITFAGRRLSGEFFFRLFDRPLDFPDKSGEAGLDEFVEGRYPTFSSSPILT